MRKLTLRRKKIFMTAQGDIKVFIEHHQGELDVDGIKCREVELLKDGGTGEYDIPNERVCVFFFPVLKRFDPNHYNFYHIPEGYKNVELYIDPRTTDLMNKADRPFEIYSKEESDTRARNTWNRDLTVTAHLKNDYPSDILQHEEQGDVAMRKLTLRRKKSAVGKNVKLGVFIEHDRGELEIGRVKYRQVSILENGGMGEYDVPSESVKICTLHIGKKIYPHFSFHYRVPAGTKNTELYLCPPNFNSLFLNKDDTNPPPWVIYSKEDVIRLGELDRWQ